MSDSGGANVCLGDSLPHISFIFPFSSSLPGLFEALVALIFQLLLFPFFCVADDDALVEGVCWKFVIAPSTSSCTYAVYQTFPVEHELTPSHSTGVCMSCVMGGGARMAFPPGLRNPASLVHHLPGHRH